MPALLPAPLLWLDAIVGCAVRGVCVDGCLFGFLVAIAAIYLCSNKRKMRYYQA
jgi:hypothetical protein